MHPCSGFSVRRPALLGPRLCQDVSTYHTISSVNAIVPNPRVDGKGPYFYIPFLSDWSGGNAGFEAPAYADGSFSYYRRVIVMHVHVLPQ
jgi:hypothetical protein